MSVAFANGVLFCVFPHKNGSVTLPFKILRFFAKTDILSALNEGLHDLCHALNDNLLSVSYTHLTLPTKA
mgnify:CR=1 FL=1